MKSSAHVKIGLPSWLLLFVGIHGMWKYAPNFGENKKPSYLGLIKLYLAENWYDQQGGIKDSTKK